MSSMIYTGEGQTVTVGTTEGKRFLQTHSVILSSFNSHFLYGKFGLCLGIRCHFLFIIVADFEKQQKSKATSHPEVFTSADMTEWHTGLNAGSKQLITNSKPCRSRPLLPSPIRWHLITSIIVTRIIMDSYIILYILKSICFCYRFVNNYWWLVCGLLTTAGTCWQLQRIFRVLDGEMRLFRTQSYPLTAHDL